jgi:hypothetical protein
MMMKSMKRLVLTGAAVMVMMSFAAPAMAADLTDLIDPSAGYTKNSSTKNSSFDYSGYQQPDIGTAGERIPVEAGGPAPPTGPTILPDGSEVVGPAPYSTCFWVWTGDHWEIQLGAGDGTGNLIPC